MASSHLSALQLTQRPPLAIINITIKIVRPVLSRSHHKKAQHTRGPLFSALPDDSDKDEKPGLLGELDVEEVLILVVLDGPLETWVILALSPWFVASSLIVSMMETVWTCPLVPFISSRQDRLLCLAWTVFNYNLASSAWLNIHYWSACLLVSV